MSEDMLPEPRTVGLIVGRRLNRLKDDKRRQATLAILDILAEATIETCRNGHEKTPESTYVYPSYSVRAGTSYCRVCVTEAGARYRQRKREREQAVPASTPEPLPLLDLSVYFSG